MSKATKHRHRAKKGEGRTLPFMGPVDSQRPNPAAHGNVREVDGCACGATRATNINGRHAEVGRWHDPHSDD